MKLKFMYNKKAFINKYFKQKQEDREIWEKQQINSSSHLTKVEKLEKQVLKIAGIVIFFSLVFYLLAFLFNIKNEVFYSLTGFSLSSSIVIVFLISFKERDNSEFPYLLRHFGWIIFVLWILSKVIKF